MTVAVIHVFGAQVLEVDVDDGLSHQVTPVTLTEGGRPDAPVKVTRGDHEEKRLPAEMLRNGRPGLRLCQDLCDARSVLGRAPKGGIVVGGDENRL